MTTLIILGNTNEFTFANSIIAANAKSKEIFSSSINEIQVIHSFDSQSQLFSKKDWIAYLKSNNIGNEIFVHRLIEIASTESSVKVFVECIDSIVRGLREQSTLMVDLTNGTSLQKHLMSLVAYILDIRYQFLIDVASLFKQTDKRGFLTEDVLLPNYILAPDSTKLDDLAYLNLTEMVRYKRAIEGYTKTYSLIGKETADNKSFSRNFEESIRSKFKGDKTRDNAIYRIASVSISSNIEDFLTALIINHITDDRVKRTLGDKLQLIQTTVINEASEDFDFEFFNKFNDFILYLRNSTTHKSRSLTTLEKFKADLSVKMAFPFIEFYTDIIHPILIGSSKAENPLQLRQITDIDVAPDGILYYGLDGDNTGAILEELFISSSDEMKFTKMSKTVTKAVNEIVQTIKNTSTKDAVVFAAGDDILFKGKFSHERLRELQNLYRKITSGLTCSIGYGRSFQEVYLALKLAKTQPGKSAIVGLEFYQDNNLESSKS